jgi:hypothetical protein
VALSIGSNFLTIPKYDYRIQQARDHKGQNRFHHMMLNLCLEKLSGVGPVQFTLRYMLVSVLTSRSGILHKQATHDGSKREFQISKPCASFPL